MAEVRYKYSEYNDMLMKFSSELVEDISEGMTDKDAISDAVSIIIDMSNQLGYAQGIAEVKGESVEGYDIVIR